MPNDDKWVISSSGRHMFVSFKVWTFLSDPGFLAKIHYGNEINNIKIMDETHSFIFSQLCKCN